MSLVDDFYKAVASQIEEFYWSKGGPIFAIQLDNETGDSDYLLALKGVAMKYNMNPAWFTVTGW